MLEVDVYYHLCEIPFLKEDFFSDENVLILLKKERSHL